MFCPNREKSNFSLPICLMLRITLQNASGDTLQNIRDEMIRKKCQNDGHLCGPWQNNLLQRIRIVFNSFFTSPVYIWQKCVKDSKTCFCRRTRYALILLSCLLVSGRHQAEWVYFSPSAAPPWPNLYSLSVEYFCCLGKNIGILCIGDRSWRVAISDNGSRITRLTHPIWWALTGPFRC